MSTQVNHHALAGHLSDGTPVYYGKKDAQNPDASGNLAFWVTLNENPGTATGYRRLEALGFTGDPLFSKRTPGEGVLEFQERRAAAVSAFLATVTPEQFRNTNPPM